MFSYLKFSNWKSVQSAKGLYCVWCIAHIKAPHWHALILAFETFKKHGIFGSSELNFEENYVSMATRFKVSLKQVTILSNYMKQATVLWNWIKVANWNHNPPYYERHWPVSITSFLHSNVQVSSSNHRKDWIKGWGSHLTQIPGQLYHTLK